MHKLNNLLADINKCKLCVQHLPNAPRPVLQASSTAKLLIIGQAPGTRAHTSKTPWNDRSGDRLREWLGIDRELFYNQDKIAIMPMGFCYPGIDKNGGDKPPRRECAPQWHNLLLASMPEIKLTLLVGSYAQNYYLAKRSKASLTHTVQAWQEYLPDIIPLPHPSWRNTAWLNKNPWFLQELVPELRILVQKLLAL